jgi:hypothetical protein
MTPLVTYWVRDKEYLYTPLQSLISEGSIEVYLAADVKARLAEMQAERDEYAETLDVLANLIPDIEKLSKVQALLKKEGQP